MEFGKGEETQEITVTMDGHNIDPGMNMPVSSEYRGMSNRDCDLRLVIIFQKDSNVPLYFRYVPERLLQLSCLTTVNRKFESLGVGVNFTISDSACCNMDTVLKMLEKGIPFTMVVPEDNYYYSRIKGRMNGSKDAEICRYERDNQEFLVYSEDRILGDGYTCHVYAVSIPVGVRSHLEPDTRIIVTSDAMDAQEAVSICYVRHLADELQHSTETYVDSHPSLARSSTTAIRGHMIVSFIAASLVQLLRNDLNDQGIDAKDAYNLLKNQKCKVFKSRIIPTVKNKDVRDLYSKFGMECPMLIPRLRDD